MPRKDFSTGLPKLDRYIGNPRPGEALLSFISAMQQRRELIQPVIDYSSRARIPLLYLAANESPGDDLGGAYRLKYLDVSGLKPAASVAAVRRFMRKWGGGRYVVMEDLSAWKSLLRSERRTAELYQLLVDLAHGRRSLLVSSALKSSFGLETLGVLKGHASVCLDFLTHRGELYCSPVSVKERYLPGGSIPFRFEREDLSKEPGRTRESTSGDPTLPQEARLEQMVKVVRPVAHEEIFRRSSDPMVLFDLEGDFREVNPELARSIGYSEEELRVLNPLSIIAPAHRTRFLRFLVELGRKRKARVMVDFARKKGRIFSAEISAGSIHQNVFLGILRDVSAQRKIEITPQTEVIGRLTESEAQQRELVERSPGPVSVIQDGRYLYVNRAFLDLFGYETPEEIIGREHTALQEEPGIDWLKEAVSRKESVGGTLRVVSYRGLRKEGIKIDIEASIAPVKHAGARYVAYLRDVTGERQYEEELRRRREELQLLREIVSSGAGSGDLHKMLRSSLSNIMDVLDWEMGALYAPSSAGTGPLEMSVHRGLPGAVVKTLTVLERDTGLGGYVTKTLVPHVYSSMKYPSYLPYRSLWKECAVASICLIPLVNAERLVGIVLLCSKREKKEEGHSMDLLSAIGHQLGVSIESLMMYNELKGSEELYASLISSVPDVLYVGSPDGIMQFISPSIERLVGYAQKEFYRNKFLWLSLVHPDDKKTLLGGITRRKTDRSGTVREYRVRPKGKASYRWVRDVIVERGNGEKDDGAMGIISDISDQKAREEKIGAEVLRGGELLSGIQEGVFIYDRNLRCVQWNKAMADITGLRQDEVLGRHASETLPGYHDRDLADLLAQVLEGQTVTSEEISFEIPASGKKGFLRGTYSPMRDAAGAITGLVGIIADITVRKNLETELRESEQVLRNIIDTMADILIITDLKGTLLQVNKSFVQLLGYTRSEALGLSFPYPWLIDREMGRYVMWISTLRERNWLHDFDMTWRGKSGQDIPVSLSTTLLRNSMGEPVAMLNIARDITERARLARDLEHRNKQIEMINRIIGTANQTMDFDAIFSVIAREIDGVVASDTINIGLLNERGDALTIYASAGTRRSVKGSSIPLERSITQLAVKENRPVVVHDFAGDPKFRGMAPVDKELRSQVALPIRLKGKILGALNIGSSESYAFSDEHVRILEPLAQELGSVIDRVNLFKQVTQDSAYVHTLLDSIDSIVYTVDTQCRIREVNKAWRDFIRECGVKLADDYDGLNLFEVLPDESLKARIQQVVDPLLTGAVRIFSEEHTHHFPTRDRVYQLTINPMVIGQRITGLVFVHVDITEVKRTEEEQRMNNERLLALNEISRLASTSLRIEDILEAAVPLLKKTMAADAVAVYLRATEGTDLILLKQMGFEESIVSGIMRLNPSNSMTGAVVESNRPAFVVEKAHMDERVIPKNRELLRSARLESIAVIPLASKDKALGALDLFYSKPHDFPDQEQRLLTLVGNQLGAAIENAQLYSQLRAQIDRLTALYELSQQLTSTLDLDNIFQVVCENVEGIVPYEEFRIDFYDPSSRMKRPAFHVRSANGRRIVIPQVQQAAPIQPESPEWSVFSSKRSYRDPGGASIHVPMLSKEAIIGIMSISSSGGGRYTEAQALLLESVANLTGIALEKGKLYEETIRISLEIQQRNKELDDFTYVVSHDLKEPLISVEGFSRILQSDYAEVIQPEGRGYLDSIVSASTRMKGLIDDLLMLSRMSRPMEAFRMVPVKPIIEEIKSDMEFTIRQKKVRMVVPDDLPRVYGDETQLKVLFRNLIGNAIKFNDKPEPVIEVAFHNAENNSYLFTVRDNGIGIEPEFYEKIFVIFQRLHPREQYEGSGAGLAIVKKIIERHRGRVWVESEMGRGSTFFLTLPGAEIPGT